MLHFQIAKVNHGLVLMGQRQARKAKKVNKGNYFGDLVVTSTLSNGILVKYFLCMYGKLYSPFRIFVVSNKSYCFLRVRLV